MVIFPWVFCLPGRLFEMDMEISGTWSSESKVHILALSDDTTPAKNSASHDLGSAKNPMDFVKRKKVVPQFGIAKLVHITPIKPMVYGRHNELVNGVYKPTYNWGAPSCRKPWVKIPRNIKFCCRCPPPMTGTRGFLQTSEWVCSQQKMRF